MTNAIEYFKNKVINLNIEINKIKSFIDFLENNHDKSEILSKKSNQRNVRKIDPYDFDSYADDFELFSEFFEDYELYMRLPVWILYKYDYIQNQKDRSILDNDVRIIKDYKKTKFYLRNITNVYEPKELLKYWFLHFNPQKANDEHIESIIFKYRTYEELLFARLYRNYINPDFDDQSVLKK